MPTDNVGENRLAGTNPQLSKRLAVKLTFPYRRAREGGFDDTIIMSFETKEVVNSLLHTTRSGRHGERTYILLPGKYLVYSAVRSNYGNAYIKVSLIEVGESGVVKTLGEWKLYDGKRPIMLVEELPQEVKEVLLANREKLPLFHYLDITIS